MKLVRQTTLVFTEGNSDKVYEVDLCEVGPDKFVVNFRYGRRGAKLTEGSKTVQPVPLKEAETIFEQLVGSKTKKGYMPADAQTNVDGKKTGRTPAIAHLENPGHKAVLGGLILGRYWKRNLDRLIWRCGELGYPEIASYLLPYLTEDNHLRNYCVLYGLGSVLRKAREAQGKVVLETQDKALEVYRNQAHPQYVRRAAALCLLTIYKGKEREAFVQQLITTLTSMDLQKALVEGSPEQFTDSLKSYLNEKGGKAGRPYERYANITTLYLIDSPVSRPALVRFAANSALKPPYFRAIRHLFKAAEFRRDGEMFGLLAYRFEKDSPMYKNRTTKEPQNYISGNWIHITQEVKSASDAKVAYSSRTREYLFRRIKRKLHRMGMAEDPDFVKMATGVLLPYKDQDQYKHSGVFRFLTTKGRFSHLWKKEPEYLLTLLLKSEHAKVHDIASKYISDQKDFLNALPLETAMILLEKPYRNTAALGYELCLKFLDEENPDIDLLVSFALSGHAPARALALEWFEKVEAILLLNQQALLRLLVAEVKKIREFVEELLIKRDLDPEVANNLIASLHDKILSLKKSESQEIVRLTGFMLKAFPGELQSLDIKTVQTLLDSKLQELQDYGLRLILNYEQVPASEIILSYINPRIKDITPLAMRVLALLLDEQLVAEEGLLVSLFGSQNKQVREANTELVKRLVGGNVTFAEKILPLLVDTLLKKDFQQAHGLVLGFIKESLKEQLERLSEEECKNFTGQLLGSKHAPAQQLGAELLGRLSEDYLLTEEKLLAALCSNANQMVRDRAVELIKRLSGQNEAFVERLLPFLVGSLLKKEEREGHTLILGLIKENFQEQLIGLPEADRKRFTRNLLESKHSQAQELGVFLLTRFSDAYLLEKEDLFISLCRNPVQLLRDTGAELIKRLSGQNETFAGKILPLLLNTILEKGDAAGHSLILELIKENFLERLKLLSEDEHKRYAWELLKSKDAPAQELGVLLLGRLPDEYLITEGRLLFSLCRNKNQIVREAGAELIKRLAGDHDAFAQALLPFLLVTLLRKGEQEIHSLVLRLIKDAFLEKLNLLPEEDHKSFTWRLLNSEHSPAQELGGIMLLRLDPSHLKTSQIVKLANHEIKSVREASWAMYKVLIPRLKEEMPQAVKIMESTWEDSRIFAFAFFRDNFTDEDYTPDTLVSICDSPDAEVQAFGREMITKHFKDEDGMNYMMKLSEHPSAGMQLFVTNYLERYAQDDPKKILKLLPYFVSVLSLVNRGRVAKERIFHLLETEALKDPDSAQLAAKIMTRVSATVAIQDRNRALEIMLKIRAKFPQIPLPIQRIPTAMHSAYTNQGAN